MASTSSRPRSTPSSSRKASERPRLCAKSSGTRYYARRRCNRGRPQRRGDAPGRSRRRSRRRTRRRRPKRPPPPSRRGRTGTRASPASSTRCWRAAALAAPAARRLRGRKKEIRRGASRSREPLAPRAPVPDRVGRVPRGPAAVLRTRGSLGAPGLRVPRHGGGAAAIYALARAAAARDGRRPGSTGGLRGGDVGRDIALQVGVGRGSRTALVGPRRRPSPPCVPPSCIT